MYFKNFPIIEYKFGENEKSSAFVNLSAYSTVFDQVKDNATFYSYYTIQNGDRPDIVSDKLYGTTEYYWTIWLLNEKIRESGWPLSDTQLDDYADETWPGECLVCFGDAIGQDTDFVQHVLIDKFEIGSQVFGLQSGAEGIVYARNVNLGQLFVRLISDQGFMRNEAITNNTESPDYSIDVDFVHSPAYLATHHYEDGDGTHIDVDYSVDFRGRGPEDPSEQGGVVGDDENPDVYAASSPYTNVTIYEYLQNLNLSVSQIRVVKPQLIGQFAQLFKKSLS